jgi:hypothetical protein
MAENSTSGKPAGTTADAGTPNGARVQSAAAGAARLSDAASAVPPPAIASPNPATRRATAGSLPARTVTNDLSATPAPQATVKCPKCSATVREVARFCQRCHHTMRYECPACHHQQRTGGKCEKCGVNFIKYVGAVLAGKQAPADAIYEKLEQRSTFMKNLLVIPFTGGLALMRQLFFGRHTKS